MLYEVFGPLDMAAQKAFRRSIMFKFVILGIIWAFLLIGMGTLLVFVDSIEIGIIIILLGVFMGSFPLFAYFKPAVNNNKLFGATPQNHFMFYSRYFNVNSYNEAGVYTGNSMVEYFKLEKAEENEEYFFLFLNKATALIVPKRYVVSGNEDYLRLELSAALGVKFKCKAEVMNAALAKHPEYIPSLLSGFSAAAQAAPVVPVNPEPFVAPEQTQAAESSADENAN